MAIAPPVLYAILVWWLGTGIILYLDGLPRRTFGRSMQVATVVASVAVVGVIVSADSNSVAAAYISFTGGLLIWAWLEMGFLMGFITGPRRTRCTAPDHGFERTKQAIQTILHYELAIIAVGALLIFVTWGRENQIGTWTFFLLFAMRLSAKLNVFMGVRNLSEEFLPAHLKYLASYFTKKNMNPFFPFSMAASVIVFYLLIEGLGHADATAFENTAHAFLAALMGLAILEHIFMVMPMPLTALWGWSLRGRDDAAPAPAAIKPAEQTTHR
jgi:putative photosynthetic complex assembly protein 2